jgi:hypothetical protein
MGQLPFGDFGFLPTAVDALPVCALATDPETLDHETSGIDLRTGRTGT